MRLERTEIHGKKPEGRQIRRVQARVFGNTKKTKKKKKNQTANKEDVEEKGQGKAKQVVKVYVGGLLNSSEIRSRGEEKKKE